MSENIKIELNSLQRTNFAFPGLWEASGTNGEIILLHFRYGDLSVYICDNEKIRGELAYQLFVNVSSESKIEGIKLLLKEPKDEFCLDGFITDEELFIMLEKEELIYYEKEN